MFNKVAFIGAGSMAEAIITGVLAQDFLSAEQISVVNKENQERLTYLKNNYHVQVSCNKKQVIQDASVVVLSMKPQDIKTAIEEIKPYLQQEQIIVSVLAGVSTNYISQQLEINVPVIRVMPNTSAMIGFSATAIAGGKYATETDVEKVKQLFDTIGTTTTVEENDLHAVTGLSGSGPAYIYYMVEAMEAAAEETGLKKEVAKELIIQTLAGAAEMLKITNEHPAVLRQKITSPGGTTQAGIEALEKYKYQEAMIACIKQATARSVELGSSYQDGAEQKNK